MRSLIRLLVLLALTLASGSLVVAQSPASAADTGASASGVASKAEVQQLRSEVAAQRQTIEELKTLVEKLVQAQKQGQTQATVAPMANTVQGAQITAVADTPALPEWQPADSARSGSAYLSDAVLHEPELAPAEMAEPAQNAPPRKEPPLAAGWNGEHFFIRSADGQFSISPYGYVNTDFRAYKGDGAPADTFVLRQARFGFQGNYGSHLDFALLTDAASTSGSVVRDVYLNVRLRPEFQFQAGQFKAPFAQETGIGDTNLDFVERGFQSMLYPSAASAYRSPGAAIHGDIAGGVMQYWVGAFNGKGYALTNTTNQPEVVGRLRFYPWRNTKNDWLGQFAIGGSVDFARSRGLSGDQSFSATLPDAAYTFFPQFAINGPIERYNGEFTYIHSRWAMRGEYDQLNMFRRNVGSEQSGGLGSLSYPGITAKAWDVSTTYLLTGEKRPENGTPRVKNPLFGPETPAGTGHGWGAWELAFRFTGIQANEPEVNLLQYYTPGFVPGFNYHTFEYTAGLNWYPNYWTKYVLNVSVDQLKDPSTIGTLPQNFYVIEQRLQFRF